MKSAHSLEVLFEDQWIIVVGKPSGMLSVGYPGNRSRTAEYILADMHRSRGKIKIGAVHRLDRDTSGVMMFACTTEARERIMDEWQDIVSERVYRCVCGREPDAAPLPDSGTIDAPLAYNRNDVAFVPRKGDAKALKDAEKAVTHFRVLERGRKYDLVDRRRRGLWRSR
jgi:23S rRNA pseudouridine1911/1915/1917 synthase